MSSGSVVTIISVKKIILAAKKIYERSKTILISVLYVNKQEVCASSW
jgi:hypothetical protein